MALATRSEAWPGGGWRWRALSGGYVTWFGALVAVALAAGPSLDIKSDEEIVFFPTYGRIDKDGGWVLSIHGWIYEPETDDTLRHLGLTFLVHSLGLDKAEVANEVFQRRARLFIVDNERSKKITIRLGGNTHSLGESDAAGHFRGTVRLSAAEAKKLVDASGWMCFEAVTSQGDERTFCGRVVLPGDTGLSVVSDIDDTIKVTQVRDKAALVANTFLREFEPAEGMADLYAGWAARGAVFHYVSASPWQLYQPLEEFREKYGYPPGTFHLKDFRPKDTSFFNLFASPEETKRQVIVPLLEAFPRRKFLFVGDSGEMDPEIYGALAREYPGRVVRILIRDVTNEKPDAERYKKAFAGLPKESWQVFRDPKEVAPLPESAFP